MCTYIHGNNEKENNSKTERQTKKMRMIDRENNNDNRIAFKIDKILQQLSPLFNGSLSAPQVRYISWSLFPYTVPRSTLNKNWKFEEK